MHECIHGEDGAVAQMLLKPQFEESTSRFPMNLF